MIHRMLFCVVSFAALLPAAASQAEQSPNWQRCVNKGKAFSSDVAISGCTAVLQSKQGTQSNRAIAFNNRGMAWNDKGEHDVAIGDLNEAIRLNPKLAVAYSNRGRAYRGKGDHDRAIADYTTAIKLDPKPGATYNNRGLVYEDMNDYDRALADYERSIKLDPKYGYAYSNRAISFVIETTWIAPLQTMTGRSSSGSSLYILPIMVAASPGTERTITTVQSPTTARRYGSIPTTLRPTTNAATPDAPSATTTRPSMTTARR